MGILTNLIGLFGSVISSFFGFRGKQSETISKAMDVLSDVNKSDDARAIAAAQIISAEARSEAWLTRIWRPLTVLGFVVILFAYFLGYVPHNVSEHVIDRVFDIVEYSVLGYMGMRSGDKWVKELQLSKIVQAFINKKI